jgi:hypothetical protein
MAISWERRRARERAHIKEMLEALRDNRPFGAPKPFKRVEKPDSAVTGQSHNDPFYEVRVYISAMTLLIGSDETEVRPLNG